MRFFFSLLSDRDKLQCMVWKRDPVPGSFEPPPFRTRVKMLVVSVVITALVVSVGYVLVWLGLRAYLSFKGY
jgi:hypothetical protein